MSPVITASTSSIWRLTWPTILSNIAFMLMGLVFLKIAGGMGTDEVAAATTGQRLFFMFYAIMMGLSSGTTAMVGRYWGGGDKDLAGRLAALSVVIFSFDGLLLCWIAIPFREQLVGIFGLTQESNRLAVEFVFWTILFAPAMLAQMVLSFALRATGDTATPLAMALISVILGVYCGIASTFGWHGLASRGLSGLAIGSGLGATITVAGFLALWVGGALSLSQKIRFQGLLLMVRP